jgi:hypothetical protein
MYKGFFSFSCLKPPAMFAGGFFIAILHRAPFGVCGILISFEAFAEMRGLFCA